MSLKAKLEAVIYAAEEPVTLAQLAVLFAADALEWKAEREAVSAERASEAASEAAQPLLLESGDVANIEVAPEPVAPQPAPVESAAETEAEPTPEAEAPAITEEAASGTTKSSEAEAELEARRQARQLDREVRAILREILDEIVAECVSDGRGVEIREIAGGYRMATKPECHDAVRMFVKSLKPALRLSLPALETLAVIAYKQPVTAPEVNEIRGVDSSGVFGSLLARKLIATAGRKPVIGRPILYKTTREFLLRFGLKDVSELPSMDEFEKMAASELDEPVTATNEDAAPSSHPTLRPEFDEAASEELEDGAARTAEIDEARPAPTQANLAEPEPVEAAPAAPTAQEQEEETLSQ